MKKFTRLTIVILVLVLSVFGVVVATYAQTSNSILNQNQKDGIQTIDMLSMQGMSDSAFITMGKLEFFQVRKENPQISKFVLETYDSKNDYESRLTGDELFYTPGLKNSFSVDYSDGHYFAILHDYLKPAPLDSSNISYSPLKLEYGANGYLDVHILATGSPEAVIALAKTITADYKQDGEIRTVDVNFYSTREAFTSNSPSFQYSDLYPDLLTKSEYITY